MYAHFNPFLENRAVRATGFVFVAAGVLLGSWTVLIPFIKTKFELDEAELGLLLLCMPAGAMLTNPFTVAMLRRFGVVRSTLYSEIFAASMFVLPVVLPQVWMVGLALFLTGAAYTCINIAMNTCASELEHRCNIRIMGSCHGLWSSGAMLGSALTSQFIGWGLHPVSFVLAALVLQLSFVFWVKTPLKQVPEPGHRPTPGKKRIFTWPNRLLWLLIIIGLCVSLTEGSMTDWSGVYMREVLLVPEAKVGWGFACYAFFMAGGRFLGDGLLGKYGSRHLLQTCGVLACFGLLILVSVPGLWLSLFGFALIGAGVSVGAPILYAESAKVPGMPPGAGLATFNTFAMVGFLGGPAFIGLLANRFDLPAALGFVAFGAAVWVVVSGRK